MYGYYTRTINKTTVMKYIDLKGYSTKAFRATVIVGLLGALVVFSFFFVGLMARYGEVGVIVPFIVIGFLLIFSKRFFRRNYRIGVSEEQVVFLHGKSGEPLCPPVAPNELAMIQHRINLGDDYLHFIRRGELKPFLKIATMGQAAQVRELLIEIGRHTSFVQSTTKQGWDQYINKETAQNSPEAVRKLRKKNGSPGKKGVKIFALAAFAFLTLVIVLMAVNKSDEGYRIGMDEITYNGEPLDIDRKEYKWLSGSVIKDSTRVFFNGEIVDWADAPTFENIGRVFFRDKNGLYQEQLNILSKNKLIPLEGDFDPATFTSVDATTFYKDKDRVYYFDFNLGSGKNPLKRLKIDGIDAPTFEEVEGGHNWYRDKNRVYFGGWSDFRPCPEIDRETFEILTWQVSKDQNHVYYLTRFLSSEGKKSTERDNYAILDGAHAPSFTLIDRNNFEDKNTTWTIEGPEDRNSRTRTRGDVE